VTVGKNRNCNEEAGGLRWSNGGWF